MTIEQIQEDFEIDVGAPMPTILSNEHRLYLIFYMRNCERNIDDTNIHLRNESDEGIVTIRFDRFEQFKFGNPNDEAIHGHPLCHLGLQPYSIQKVIGSEWIQDLIKMNSVHPYHSDDMYSGYEHFIFFFHDTCFEIVAKGYSIEENSELTMEKEILRIAALL